MWKNINSLSQNGHNHAPKVTTWVKLRSNYLYSVLLSLSLLTSTAVLNSSCTVACHGCDDIEQIDPTCNDVDIVTSSDFVCEQIGLTSAAFGFKLGRCDEWYPDLKFDLNSNQHGITDYEIIYNIPGWSDVYVWNDDNDVHTISPDQLWWTFSLRVTAPTNQNVDKINVDLEAESWTSNDRQNFQKELAPTCDALPVEITNTSVDVYEPQRADGDINMSVELCETLQTLTMSFGATFGHGGKIQFRVTLADGSQRRAASSGNLWDQINIYTWPRTVTPADLWLNDFSDITNIEAFFWASPSGPRNNVIPTGPAGGGVDHQVILGINGVNSSWNT